MCVCACVSLCVCVCVCECVYVCARAHDILRPVQTQSTKQNGRPGGFCSSG